MKKLLVFTAVLFMVDGTAQCWQSVSAGQSLGLKTDGTIWRVNFNSQDDTQTWRFLSKGLSSYHLLAIRTDGTLWSRGQNIYGQLGIGDSDGGSTNSFSQVGQDADWSVVATGDDFSCGIKDNGTLWTWGRNNYGQLGDGANIDKNVPIQIGTDNNWKSIDCGARHMVAVKTDGTLWSWGFGAYLGLGDVGNSNLPIQIGDETNWDSVAVGSVQSFAIKNEDTLWGWGANNNGGLGTGTSSTFEYFPVQIGTDANWRMVSNFTFVGGSSAGGCGGTSTLAIKTDGTLWGWSSVGVGGSCNPLAGGTIFFNVPTHIATESSDWQIADAGSVSYAIRNDGSLWSIGTYNSTWDTNMQITCGPLNNVEWKSYECTVFPNPVENLLYIQSNHEILGYNILNVQGNKLQAIKGSGASIDVSFLPVGLYFLKIDTQNGTFLKKIVKQ